MRGESIPHPRTGESSETQQQRCEMQIESILQDLDGTYSPQSVNDVLQYIFVPPSNDAPPSELVHVITERLRGLRDELGEEVVEAALDAVDARRSPRPPMREEPKPSDAEKEASHAALSEMMTTMSRLRDEHPDAYELAGGEEQGWHLDEMPAYGFADETSEFQQQLARLQAFEAVAADTSLPPEVRTAKLEELGKGIW